MPTNPWDQQVIDFESSIKSPNYRKQFEKRTGHGADNYLNLLKSRRDTVNKRNRNAQFEGELGQFDTHQRSEADRLIGLFRNESDLRQARSRNTAFTSLNQELARRGIRGPAEGAGVRDVETALLSRMSQEQADFNTRLAQLQSAQRSGFIQNEFNFFHELQRMEVAFDYERAMTELRADIAADQSKAGQFLDFGKLLGAAGIWFLFPPAAPVVAGSVLGTQAPASNGLLA